MKSGTGKLSPEEHSLRVQRGKNWHEDLRRSQVRRLQEKLYEQRRPVCPEHGSGEMFQDEFKIFWCEGCGRGWIVDE